MFKSILAFLSHLPLVVLIIFVVHHHTIRLSLPLSLQGFPKLIRALRRLIQRFPLSSCSKNYIQTKVFLWKPAITARPQQTFFKKVLLMARTRSPQTSPLSWSAASLATIAALSSLGTPAFAHHDRYRDNPDGYTNTNHPHFNEIIPICTPAMLAAIDRFRPIFASLPAGKRSRIWEKDGYTYSKYQLTGEGNTTRSCHAEKGKDPFVRTEEEMKEEMEEEEENAPPS